uniref:Uncharacterized protein n=1 Tax=Chlamydomonas leiostraca TaxID=1034604 RepID=A0A7S0R918_9CHLO|mmetsp:Transcript_16709/g.41787  ORF Transcript_16709/g.41787 Transcript_16709/m.41787 type:complete len:362 (+) Transcript_16709:78-1163(+)
MDPALAPSPPLRSRLSQTDATAQVQSSKLRIINPDSMPNQQPSPHAGPSPSQGRPTVSPKGLKFEDPMLIWRETIDRPDLSPTGGAPLARRDSLLDSPGANHSLLDRKGSGTMSASFTGGHRPLIKLPLESTSGPLGAPASAPSPKQSFMARLGLKAARKSEAASSTDPHADAGGDDASLPLDELLLRRHSYTASAFHSRPGSISGSMSGVPVRGALGGTGGGVAAAHMGAVIGDSDEFQRRLSVSRANWRLAAPQGPESLDASTHLQSQTHTALQCLGIGDGSRRSNDGMASHRTSHTGSVVGAGSKEHSLGGAGAHDGDSSGRVGVPGGRSLSTHTSWNSRRSSFGRSHAHANESTDGQ